MWVWLHNHDKKMTILQLRIYTARSSWHKSCWLAPYDIAVLLLQGVQQKPLHDYFINFPGVSRWHWHPLTCLYPQGGQQGVPGSTVTFAMKQKGRWSTVMPHAINKIQ